MSCFSVVAVAETTHHCANSFLGVVAGDTFPAASSLHFDAERVVVRSSLAYLTDSIDSLVAIIARCAESKSGVVGFAEITDRKAQAIEEEVPVDTLYADIVPDPLAVGFVFVGVGH